MSLTDEQIEALLAGEFNKANRVSKPLRQIRTRIHYPNLPAGGIVTRHDTFTPNKSLRCASRGCSASTCYKIKGVPKCSIHLIIELVLLLQARQGENSVADFQKESGTGNGSYKPTGSINAVAIAEYPSECITDEGLL